MKKLSKFLLLTVLLAILSCQNQDEDLLINNEIETSSRKLIPENLIDFRGLKVNHRFSKQLKKGKSKTKKSISNTSLVQRVNPIDYIDPIDPIDPIDGPLDEKYYSNPQRLIAVVENILGDFPYGIDSDFSENDMNMIRNDFPLLSDDQIASQMDVIEDYYSLNFENEYKLKYDELYSSPIKIKFDGLIHQRSNISILDGLCLIEEAGYGISNPIKFIKALYSLYKSEGVAETISLNEYGSSMDANDTKRDAFRHMIWNAMLAQYYFTVTRKAPRINFAKAFTDVWEESSCRIQTNTDAAKNMDLHNNHIGRSVWNNQANYAYSFFGIPFGLSTPTRQQLTVEFNTKISAARFINVTTLGVPTTVSEINATHSNIAVYIKRPNITFNTGDEIRFERINSEFNIRVDLSDGNFSNQIIPRQYFIKSIDNLGIQVGDKLDAYMKYKGSEAIYNNGANGFDGLESITITYNGEATVIESLGDNKFLIGFTDNNAWSVRSTTQETNIQNWRIDFYEVDFNATYIYK